MQKVQFALGLLVLAAAIVATSRPAVELVASEPTAVAPTVSLPSVQDAPLLDVAAEAGRDPSCAATGTATAS